MIAINAIYHGKTTGLFSKVEADYLHAHVNLGAALTAMAGGVITHVQQDAITKAAVAYEEYAKVRGPKNADVAELVDTTGKVQVQHGGQV